ncbi:MAG TPA: zinc ribbon domain-containing protein [Gemmatimonadales bacterium]|nr:zinc ribbon domain-containing protein [Gemmatimonadales bacterium]
MPTYEYQCPDGHVFDKFQKMTDKPRAKCPVCGKVAARKISGGAGLVFRGSGFYITDYGKDGKGPRKPDSEKPAASPGEPKSDAPRSEPKPAKADAKPAVKKPGKATGE